MPALRQHRAGTFARMLAGRFAAASPGRRVFAGQLLAYHQECAVEGRGRKNRTTTLQSINRTITRWLGGCVPEPAYRPVIAQVLGETTEAINNWCDPPKHLGYESSIWRFQSVPRVVLSSWEMTDGSFAAHAADMAAYRLLADNRKLMNSTVLDPPLLSGEPSCPTKYTDGELILVCGPNGNDLSRQLNAFLSQSDWDTFYFKAIVRQPKPDLPTVGEQWVISHSMIDMRVALPGRRKDRVVDDYGIFYAGINPEAPDHYLIWLAGLGSHGTFGAARAFLDANVQGEIARSLEGGKKYVSGLVKCACTGYLSSQTIKVWYA